MGGQRKLRRKVLASSRQIQTNTDALSMNVLTLYTCGRTSPFRQLHSRVLLISSYLCYWRCVEVRRDVQTTSHKSLRDYSHYRVLWRQGAPYIGVQHYIATGAATFQRVFPDAAHQTFRCHSCFQPQSQARVYGCLAPRWFGSTMSSKLGYAVGCLHQLTCGWELERW